MMKTSVFALEKQGSGGEEGRGNGGDGFAHHRHLLSLLWKRVSLKHNADYRLAPGEGEDQQVGVSARAITLLGGQP